VRRRRRSSAS